METNGRDFANRRWLRVGLWGLLGVAILVGFVMMNRSGRAQWLSTVSMKELRAEVTQYPDDDEAAYTFAYRLVHDGQANEALPLVERLLKRQPNSALYWFGYARCVSQLGRVRDTVRAYQKIAELEPKEAYPHSYLGQIYAEAGLTTEALEEYDHALQLDAKASINLELLCKGLMATGRDAEAWDRLTTSLSQNPIQDSAYSLMAQAGLKLGKVEDVEIILWRRLSLSAVYPFGVVRATLARVLLTQPPTQKLLQEAEEQAEIAVTDPAPKAEYDAVLGRVRLLRGNLKGARSALEKGLKRQPDNVECLTLLAQVLDKQGDVTEAAHARARLAKATRQDPRLASLRKAVAAAPEDVNARLALASALASSGAAGEAAEACHEVLKRAPQNRDAQTLLETCRKEALQNLEASIARKEKPNSL